jgi:hypothetical protein
MTTSIGLIMMVTLLVASGGVILLRGSKLKRLDRWQTIIFLTLTFVGIFFFVWLAIMVFVVGPSMRAI